MRLGVISIGLNMLYIESYNFLKTQHTNCVVINTTSRSDNWSVGLSPFYCGPCKLYGDYISTNVENGWQASKLYKEFADENGNPTQQYFDWAKKIWEDPYAHRYPMGKGAIPLCSYWDGEKLDYIAARQKIYIPLYAEAVKKTDAYKKLEEMYQLSSLDIYLVDFDGYNHKSEGITYQEVILNPNRKMGHAFVLGMLLEGVIK